MRRPRPFTVGHGRRSASESLHQAKNLRVLLEAERDAFLWPLFAALANAQEVDPDSGGAFVVSAEISAGLKWLNDQLAAEDLENARVTEIASRTGRQRASKLKAQLPYVPWYHGDFLRSTTGWTLMEQAVYWKLLCAQWEIGPLPTVPNRLAAIVGIGIDEFLFIWQEVGKKFVRIKPGTPDERLVNERMEAHRTKYLEYRAEQAKRGKKGMEARWGGSKRGKKAESTKRHGDE
jgi:hypothetical protein